MLPINYYCLLEWFEVIFTNEVRLVLDLLFVGNGCFEYLNAFIWTCVMLKIEASIIF
jgi:hypothetical protein